VLLGVDGISDFDGLHSRKHNDEVQFYAFEVLVDGGDNLRKLPLHLRKNNLSGLLVRRVGGIFLLDYERGEIGPAVPPCLPNGAWRAWSRSIGSGLTVPAIAALDKSEKSQVAGYERAKDGSW
jgi:hypothetical protein